MASPSNFWRRRIRLAANICEVGVMTLEYVLGGVVTAGLLVYLTYVLLRPERF
jgi:K+-transporting ATPase KdpF subunit